MEKITISLILKRVIRQLVDADYVSIYEADQDKKILPEEIKEAISDYPGKLTYPPDSAFANFVDYGTIDDSENQIEFTLWYDDEPSDLTLSLTAYKSEMYSLDDIRVT